jgi:hypothetical protein
MVADVQTIGAMNGAFYRKEKNIAVLEPIYDIDERDIENFMRSDIDQESDALTS